VIKASATRRMARWFAATAETVIKMILKLATVQEAGVLRKIATHAIVAIVLMVFYAMIQYTGVHV
jgi:hypothetical protein